jgi:beta-glucosidase
MWWPGDEGGWSTAKLLLGKADPAGRLPMTWGKRLEDYPATDPAHPERSDKGVGGKTTYSEGVLIGYRWFDAQKIEPLFPFGFGLSYTRFVYSDMKAVADADGGATVTVKVKNVGMVAGDEVPQVYLEAPATASMIAGAQFAPQTLAAFDRVTLAPGQEKTVTLKVAARAFQYWSTDADKWVTPAGSRTLDVGASSRDLRLKAEVR